MGDERQCQGGLPGVAVRRSYHARRRTRHHHLDAEHGPASPGLTAYQGSKGAVEQFSAVAARELGGRGITVNVVSPGATDTDLLRTTNSADGLAMAVRRTPLGRLGQPGDVADVVAFLAGPDARWVTGQNVHATGGIG